MGLEPEAGPMDTDTHRLTETERERERGKWTADTWEHSAWIAAESNCLYTLEERK